MFSEFELNPRTDDNVKMGYIFEDLIRRFSEYAESDDHYTGRDIIKLMVSILLAEGRNDIFEDGKVIIILDPLLKLMTVLTGMDWQSEMIAEMKEEGREVTMVSAYAEVEKRGYERGFQMGNTEGETRGRILAYHEMGISNEEIAEKVDQPVNKVVEVIQREQ